MSGHAPGTGGSGIDAAGIEAAWVHAVVSSGGARDAAAASAVDLVRRYDEPHRRYHTGVHVAAVLRDGAVLAAALGLDRADRSAVVLAACAHDVVYDARPGDDERASAQWASAALAAAGVAPSVVERVAGLVLATLAHDADPTDAAALALLDADLAILASPPARYDAYVRAVRGEYAAVDDEQWRFGRSAVLAGLLGRPALFLSGPGRDRWESAARANVEAELAQLTGTS